MNSFFSEKETKDIGFGKIGSNVQISRYARIYGAEKMDIGSNVRIDDFCLLSGKITLGSNIHIAAYSALYGGSSGIEMHDFSNISSRVTIYAISDDFSGGFMTNPTVPNEYRNVVSAKVILKKHVIIGASSVVFPGVTLEEGSSFGAMSLITKSSEPWSINVGIPAKYLKSRKKDLLLLEKTYLSRCK